MVYTRLSQFRSEAARRIAEQADRTSDEIERLQQMYDRLQQVAAGGRTESVTNQLLQINKELPALKVQLHTLERICARLNYNKDQRAVCSRENDDIMTKTPIAPSELIINSDGSIFHLHVKPEQLADKVILVGDPGRVPLVASHFDTKECDVSSREFRTITGTYQGKRITVVSTGIGCDNIDIVVNELDALANIDLPHAP